MGPGGVVSALDVPFGHLALDDSWCGALPSSEVEASEETLEDEQPAGAVAFMGVRGKGVRVGEGLPGDPQRGDEGDAVRVVAGVGGGLGHEGPDRVVAAQMSLDLLEDEFG